MIQSNAGRNEPNQVADPTKRHIGLIVSENVEYLFAYSPEFGAQEVRIIRKEKEHCMLRVCDWITFKVR